MIYAFGDCKLDITRRELRRSGDLCSVEPQVFDLLVFLVENRDRVVGRDELIDHVWGGRVISDATLSSRISAARHAVGDSGEAQAMLRTLPRRGFRFVADVAVVGSIGEPAASRFARPNQTIRFCATSDGVNLAYACSGQGPLLIKTANWLNHLEHDWVSPVFRDIFVRLSAEFQLLRYDERGTGLSDWDVADISFRAFVDDLEAVVAAAGADRFALLGLSQGAAVAVDFAARHPDRVSHLVLWGGFARGRARRDSPDEADRSEAYLTLMRQGWGKRNSAFRRMFASLYLPDGKPEHIDWFTDLQQVATSPDNAVRVRKAIDEIDVSALLPRITAPTLILHSRDEAVVPIEEARFVAAQIPNAHFVSLDSSNHLVLSHEAEWERAIEAIIAFLRST